MRWTSISALNDKSVNLIEPKSVSANYFRSDYDLNPIKDLSHDSLMRMLNCYAKTVLSNEVNISHT